MQSSYLWQSVLAILLLIFVGCDNPTDPSSKDSNESLDIVFDSGQGSGLYDSMTYAEYESDIWFIPQDSLLVRALHPQIWYCNGTCGFTVFIRDEHYQPVASQAGLVDGTGYMTPTFPDRYLDQTVLLLPDVTYRIVMNVWSTKSVGIYTTGDRTTSNVGSAEYEVISASHVDRGAIAFLMFE